MGLLTTILGTWYSKAARKGLTHQDGEVFPYLKFSSHSPGVLWLHTGEGRCTNLTRQQATHLSKGLREWVDCEEVHKNSLSGSGQ